MKEASITIRVDPAFKEECDSLFSKLGISTPAAINMFLHQSVMKQAIPFRIESVEDPLTRALRMLPEAGHIGKDGVYVLPKEWDNPEDEVYDDL